MASLILIRYFLIDSKDRLRKVAQTVMEGIWRGRGSVSRLGFEVGDEFKIVSVLTDSRLCPVGFWLMRVKVADRAINEQSWLGVIRAVAETGAMDRSRLDPHFPAYHFADWPVDLLKQLAEGLDIPVTRLPDFIGWGGPLPLATQLGLTVRGVLPYYERILGKSPKAPSKRT